MIFNIQRYSTHDGPGIRSVIFLKGCSLGCRWCQNPESRSGHQQVMYDPRLCLAECRLCIDRCPQAIERRVDQPEKIHINRHKLSAQDIESLQQCCPTQALTVCGSEANIDDIMAKILKDKAFYQRSGGGVTLSGGEPFMQPQLAQQLLKSCKEAGIHTAIESCLHVPWHYIEPSLDYCDLFLADIKHVDEQRFLQWTDGSAKRIMINLKKLVSAGKSIIIRVPLIPDFNADRDSINAIVNFAADELAIDEIHFLPYHTLGINKYSLLDMPYLAAPTPLDDPGLLQYAQDYAISKKIKPILRG